METQKADPLFPRESREADVGDGKQDAERALFPASCRGKGRRR
jgi:hypothetical protein